MLFERAIVARRLSIYKSGKRSVSSRAFTCGLLVNQSSRGSFNWWRFSVFKYLHGLMSHRLLKPTRSEIFHSLQFL